MMKLWGGRFTKEENKLVHEFNESLSFDQRMYRQDIAGSIAHVTMLARQGIVSEEDKEAIIRGLRGIQKDMEEGTLVFTKEHEDIHSFVEANLTERIGEAGKRLHTGRSRNDQVALDMKLYCREEAEEIDRLVLALLEELLKIEDKELTFDAIDTVKGCLALFTGMISTISFRKDVMENSAKNGFTNATDAADYLVGKGVPFRDAHGIVGQLVLLCIEKGVALDDLTLEEYRSISPVFDMDIYEAISMKTCVEKRMTVGAPGPGAMKQVVNQCRQRLDEEKQR